MFSRVETSKEDLKTHALAAGLFVGCLMAGALARDKFLKHFPEKAQDSRAQKALRTVASGAIFLTVAAFGAWGAYQVESQHHQNHPLKDIAEALRQDAVSRMHRQTESPVPPPAPAPETPPAPSVVESAPPPIASAPPTEAPSPAPAPPIAKEQPLPPTETPPVTAKPVEIPAIPVPPPEPEIPKVDRSRKTLTLEDFLDSRHLIEELKAIYKDNQEKIILIIPHTVMVPALRDLFLDSLIKQRKPSSTIENPVVQSNNSHLKLACNISTPDKSNPKRIKTDKYSFTLTNETGQDQNPTGRISLTDCEAPFWEKAGIKLILGGPLIHNRFSKELQDLIGIPPEDRKTLDARIAPNNGSLTLKIA